MLGNTISSQDDGFNTDEQQLWNMKEQQGESPLLEEEEIKWTLLKIMWSISVFFMAGVAEIVGGWMVWSAVRGGVKRRPWWFACMGSLVLILYGFIPCAQPTDNFGRIYAVYGGFFIIMSFLFGWVVDGNRPDNGDIVGGMIAMVGVLVVMLWPRARVAS